MTTAMQAAFEKAWETTSTNQMSKDAAQNWFYEGVAAQKLAAPKIRMADAEAFAAQRSGMGGYRVAINSIITSEAKFVSEIIRAINKEHDMNISFSDAHFEEAVSHVRRMIADGCIFNQLSPTSIAKKRDRAYIERLGYKELRDLLDHVFENQGSPLPKSI